MSPHTPTHGKLPAAIWVLGFVSLLMDISSELIHSLLPVFLVTGLGASMVTVGLLEGAAEATALTEVRAATAKAATAAAAALIAEKHDAKADKALVDQAIAGVAKG